MLFAGLMFVLGVAMIAFYFKIKNDRIQDIAESDLDDNLDQDLVDAAMAPPKQNWDAAQ